MGHARRARRAHREHGRGRHELVLGGALRKDARPERALGRNEVGVKLWGNSHSGSFKDLGMTVLVSVARLAIERGLKVKAVACASTGDTSASLAAYGAAAGLPVVVLLPRGKITTGQLV